MDDNLEMAIDAMGRALLEEDVSERYALYRYAELRIRIADVRVLEKLAKEVSNGFDYLGRVLDIRLKRL